MWMDGFEARWTGDVGSVGLIIPVSRKRSDLSRSLDRSAGKMLVQEVSTASDGEWQGY